MGAKRKLRAMFWLVLVMGLFTSLGVMLFPALGPFQSFNIAPAGSFVPEIEHVHSGRDLNFALAHLTGVVCFPSFHTAMALAYIWGFRRTGPIGWAITALNLIMLISIPYFGGHYLVDMIAGAGVFAVSLATVKAIGHLRPDNKPDSKDVFADLAPALLIADGARSWRQSVGNAAD